MKNFALIGAAGYIAPRHIQAIFDTKNRLVCATDPHDSVGILDRYHEDVHYFKEFERFDRHIEKLSYQSSENKVDYISVCSPNYLHDAHIRFGLRAGCHVICEKPLVINPWNIDALADMEARSNHKINTVLQLRVHPSIIELKKKIDSEKRNEKYEVNLSYFTSRGSWYYFSWKGDQDKSGGLPTNIGIHFFDMLGWLFGNVEKNEVHIQERSICAGYLELEKARVKWVLSIDKSRLPDSIKNKGQYTYRSITIDGKEIEFSGGFGDLHTRVYEGILNGQGYGVEDARTAIQMVHDIRKAEVIGINSSSHPLLLNKN